MKQLNNENAANRSSYVGFVYDLGEKTIKNEILKALPKSCRMLHEEGFIHIHDLDAHGLTYNCLTIELYKSFPYSEFNGLSNTRKIIRLFDFIKSLFADLGNEQSGGMAFANFDIDIAIILKKLNVKLNESNKEIIKDCISDLIIWCNNTHTRMGQTSYYTTFNIGLADCEEARFIAYTLLDEFYKSGDLIYKPNIVFKVHKGVNRFKEDPNYDLYLKSLLTTAKKMIPTYLLCDSVTNKRFDPYKLSIMGCRTRVVTDEYGCEGAIGRGNITNVSINLPKIALEIDKNFPNMSIDEKYDKFKSMWDYIASEVSEILECRYEVLCGSNKDLFPINTKYNLWCENFAEAKDLHDVFKHGTLSIGFIGLSEAIEVLTGEKYYKTSDNYVRALGLVKHMRDYCEFLKSKEHLNFSLLATAGELISGRFINIDKNLYTPKVDIFSKGYYTNSFHIDVDSGLPGYKKIQMEGLFHEVCNGGCITYVELGEAPLTNTEGLQEYIEIGMKSGTHYLGFNFPKDICNECGCTGVFDECPHCHSKNITRIRRVSGYLEILDGFTDGKKAEEKNRRAN